MSFSYRYEGCRCPVTYVRNRGRDSSAMPPATAPTVAPTAAPAGPPTIAPPTAPVAAPVAAPCANALVEPASAIRNVATIIFCISTLRLIDGRKRGGFPNVPDYVALYLLSAEQRLCRSCEGRSERT